LFFSSTSAPKISGKLVSSFWFVVEVQIKMSHGLCGGWAFNEGMKKEKEKKKRRR
jgi:hypothetical protein